MRGVVDGLLGIQGEAKYWRSLFAMLLDKENERIGDRAPVLPLGVRRELLISGLRWPCD